MDRRRFLAEVLGGAAAVAGPAVGLARTGETGPHPAPPKARMKAGHQNHSSDADLRTLAAFGVNHVCSDLPSRHLDENWSVDALTGLRKRVESFGITLEMVPLPLSSSPIESVEYPHIMLGESPERDREIEALSQMIRNASQAGIGAVKYNLSILGVLRTGSAAGRGSARYSAFEFRKAALQRSLTAAGVLNDETVWSRIRYFLERVVPVAEKERVRLCCHPHDPGLPPGEKYRGVPRVLGSVDGLKRFVDTAPSEYHGLNFCQGTVSEMLERPGETLYDVIRYFGRKGKIFNVHFRNIRGHRGEFMETFPDDGDVDMIRAMRVYREIGYDGMIMPDHAPGIPGDSSGAQAFAFEIGYIQALIQLVRTED